MDEPEVVQAAHSYGMPVVSPAGATSQPVNGMNGMNGMSVLKKELSDAKSEYRILMQEWEGLKQKAEADSTWLDLKDRISRISTPDVTAPPSDRSHKDRVSAEDDEVYASLNSASPAGLRSSWPSSIMSSSNQTLNLERQSHADTTAIESRLHHFSTTIATLEHVRFLSLSNNLRCTQALFAGVLVASRFSNSD